MKKDLRQQERTPFPSVLFAWFNIMFGFMTATVYLNVAENPMCDALSGLSSPAFLDGLQAWHPNGHHKLQSATYPASHVSAHCFALLPHHFCLEADLLVRCC